MFFYECVEDEDRLHCAMIRFETKLSVRIRTILCSSTLQAIVEYAREYFSEAANQCNTTVIVRITVRSFFVLRYNDNLSPWFRKFSINQNFIE